MHNPYYDAAIDNFFDNFGYTPAKKILARILYTACSYKTWSAGSPSQVLYFTELLQQLIDTAFLITENNAINPKAILSKTKYNRQKLLTHTHTFCSNPRYTPWQYLPRHLSYKEFLNPYKALDTFTTYYTLAQWKKQVQEMQFYALSGSDWEDLPDGRSLLKLHTHLQKLIEAFHLIYVRTIYKNK
ncbi:MAG: hypothetical protein HEQ40_17210 [Lacibacter sp.]|jgi:hypothetical protein